MPNPHAPRVYAPRSCHRCGTAFRPTGSAQLYCSRRCRTAAHAGRDPDAPQNAAQRRAARGGKAAADPPDLPVPNPATAERLYDDDEAEFLKAVECYRRTRRRPFPTLGEYLHILRGLGYRKDRPAAGQSG